MSETVIVHAIAIGCGIALLATLAAATFTALKPLWRERRRELLVIAGALASIAIVKFLLLPLFPGYSADRARFLLEGEVMTRLGPGHVYDPEFASKYTPAYLYARWAVVAAASQFYLGYDLTPAVVSTLGVFARIPPLIGDFIVGLLIFAWVRALGGKRPALGAVMFFALNPALIYDSVVWGQDDSVLTLAVMLALLMASQASYGLAAAIAALAVLLKPAGIDRLTDPWLLDAALWSDAGLDSRGARVFRDGNHCVCAISNRQALVLHRERCLRLGGKISANLAERVQSDGACRGHANP